MPRVKVPERLRELAGDLELDLGDEAQFTEDPEELIAWMHEQNHNLRCEENDCRDEIDKELDGIETEMMEEPDDNA